MDTHENVTNLLSMNKDRTMKTNRKHVTFQEDDLTIEIKIGDKFFYNFKLFDPLSLSQVVPASKCFSFKSLSELYFFLHKESLN